MTIITRKRSIKLIGLLVCLLTFLTALDVALKFMSEYRYVGFEKKQGSWYGIAMQAQADSLSVQQQLDQCEADRHQQNLDGTADLK